MGQTSNLDQLEINFDATGNPVAIMRQDHIVVTNDAGGVIADTYHRSTYQASDPAVVALLQTTADASLVQINTLTGQLTAAQSQISSLKNRIAVLEKQGGQP